MLARGTFIADRYEILDKVGAGGMSDVYKAKDHILDREVAVKVLKAEFAEDVTFVTKFRSEAQSAARLSHHTQGRRARQIHPQTSLLYTVIPRASTG